MPPKSGNASSQSSTAFKRLQESIKWVDLVIEVLDARAPESSRHPNAQSIFGHKSRLVVLTKEDLADPSQVTFWTKHFSAAPDRTDGQTDVPLECVSLSLKTQRNRDKVLSAAIRLTSAKKLALQKRGLLNRATRACVVGMPNTGKSSLINWLIGINKAKVGNKPGVTRGPQWVRVHPEIELLDTPGFLPPVSFSQEVRLKLALLNLIPAQTYDAEEVAREGLYLMARIYPDLLKGYMDNASGEATLEELSSRRHFLTSGGKLDLPRAAITFLTDLRDGKLGRVTLDRLSDNI